MAPRSIYTPSTDLKSPPLGGTKAIIAFFLVAILLMVGVAHHILTGGHESTEAVRVSTSPAVNRPSAATPEPVPAPAEVALSEPATVPAPTPPEPAAEASSAPEAEPATAGLAWPAFEIKGARVVREGEGIDVIFDYGIFSRVDQLRPEARDALAAFARDALPHLDRLSIVVTGFTDNDPVPANRPYKSNYELGMMRAMAVSRELIDAGIPPAHIATRSLGDQQTPYPNDTPQNKARNRTTTLALRAN